MYSDMLVCHCVCASLNKEVVPSNPDGSSGARGRWGVAMAGVITLMMTMCDVCMLQDLSTASGRRRTSGTNTGHGAGAGI